MNQTLQEKFFSEENKKNLNNTRLRSNKFLKNLEGWELKILKRYTQDSSLLNTALLYGTQNISIYNMEGYVLWFLRNYKKNNTPNIITSAVLLDTSNGTIDEDTVLKLYNREMIESLFIKYLSLNTLILQNILLKAPKLENDCVVVKGSEYYEELPPKDGKTGKIDKNVEQRLFNSTTADFRIAEKFSGTNCCIQFLEIKKGEPLLSIEPISVYKNEREMLLPTYISFRYFFLSKGSRKKDKFTYQGNVLYPRNTTDIAFWGKKFQYSPWMLKYNWRENDTTDYMIDRISKNYEKQILYKCPLYNENNFKLNNGMDVYKKLNVDSNKIPPNTTPILPEASTFSPSNKPTPLEKLSGINSTNKINPTYINNIAGIKLPILSANNFKHLMTEYFPDFNLADSQVYNYYKSSIPVGSGLSYKLGSNNEVRILTPTGSQVYVIPSNKLQDILKWDTKLNNILSLFPTKVLSSENVKDFVLKPIKDKNNNILSFDIMSQSNSSVCPNTSKFANNSNYICNPSSGKWVTKTGPTGKKILSEIKSKK